MAKLTKASDEVIEFIENIIKTETTLDGYVTWKILSIDKQREMIKISKASATVEYLAKCSDCIIIYVNEDIFDMMAPQTGETDYRKLLVQDALATVVCSENEKTGYMKISIAKPEICITRDGHTQFGEQLVFAAESAYAAYEQIQQKEQEEKERKKAEKLSKKQ